MNKFNFKSKKVIIIGATFLILLFSGFSSNTKIIEHNEHQSLLTENIKAPESTKNTNYKLIFDEEYRGDKRSISIQYNNGENKLICDNYPSNPYENSNKTKIAYLSNYKFETKPELNIYDVETKENKIIPVKEIKENQSIKSISWFDNNILIFSVGDTLEMLYGKELYALYLDDMSIKKLAFSNDSQIYNLNKNIVMISNDNSFIYNPNLYGLVFEKENQKVYEIKFKPSPEDFENPNYMHFDGLYERNSRPYFFNSNKENNIYNIYPYAIGEFLDYDPNSETGVIPNKNGEFFGFATDWYPCGLWCRISDYNISSSATSTLKPQGIYSYDLDKIVYPIAPTRNSCWSEGADGYGIGEKITINLSFDSGGPYSYDMYKSKKVDSYGFPFIDYKTYYEGEDCIFFYTNMCIVNGYAKNETFWKENSRVKSMNLYVNDKLYGNIFLEDTIKPQYFPLYNIPAQPGKETKFTFEITDVYKGDIFDDTCLTGINFNFRGIGGMY